MRLATQASSSLKVAMLALLVLLQLVAAQVPENATLPYRQGDLQLNLYYPLNGTSNTAYSVDMTANVGQDNNLPSSDTSGFNSSGTLILTTPLNFGALTSNSIAYISCDEEDYASSNIDAASLVQMAQQKLVPSAAAAASNSTGSVILYSKHSDWCSMSITGNVFTMTSAANASALLGFLQSSATAGKIGWIAAQEFSNNSASSNIMYDYSAPSTTIAMIVLYSITGLITFLFLSMIILGAVRAHRHPERYGPRNMLGMPRQSRARGMARAMLDTIPIVKFGEGQDIKVPDGGSDVELANQSDEAAVHGTPSVAGPSSQETSEIEKQKAAGAEVNPVLPASDLADTLNDVPGATTVQIETSSTSSTGPTEETVQCPICTEDFVRGEPARVLPCKHNYHPACIDPWLLNVSSTCPLCRIDLNPPKEPQQAEMETSAAEGSRRASGHSRWNRISRLGFLDLTTIQRANPEERIEALRQAREERRAREGPSDTTEGRTRRRDRLSRLLQGDRSNRQSRLATETENVGSSERAPAEENGEGGST